MNWLGKVIGVLVGWFVLRHPYGALLGLAFGHLVDIGVFGQRERSGATRGFIEPLFGLIGALSKADGRVSEREIAVAEQLMTRMQLNESQRREAIARFNAGKQAGFATHLAIADLKAWSGGRRDHAYILIDLLLEIVCADGGSAPEKLALLRRLTWALGVHDRELAALAAMKGYVWADAHAGGRSAPPPRAATGTPDPYAVLGVAADADQRAVKRAWRKLMSEHHPDKLGDVPESLRARAELRAREINIAYERIKSLRGW